MTNSASDVTSLLNGAREAARAGDAGRATALYNQLLALAPNHQQALNELGNHYRRAGEPARAVELLRHLTTLDRHPVPLFNLGCAYRAAGEPKTALAAIEQSLALNPYFSQAHYEKADLLMERGQTPAAVVTFKKFLDCSAHDPARESFAPLIARAESIVAENSKAAKAFLSPRLTPLLRDLEPAAQHRMVECMDILLGMAKRQVPEPNFLYVPGIPAFSFYDRALFPWFSQLEAATADIRSELLALLNIDEVKQGFKPYIQRPAGEPIAGWEKLNHSLDWSVFMFWEHGRRIDDNCARCPKTAALIDSLPLCDTPRRTPTANFSLLKPHSHIPAHCGETNSRLIVHLPLIVPEKCVFRVGNETRPWVEGEAFAFDDSINHEARNDSDHLRAILMLDTWNPFVTAPERAFIKALVSNLDAYTAS